MYKTDLIFIKLLNKIFLIGIIIPLLLIPVYAQTEEIIIPSWVKGVFVYWVDGGINDSEIISALEFLVNENVIKLENNITVERIMSENQFGIVVNDSEQVKLLKQQSKKESEQILELKKTNRDLEIINESMPSKEEYEFQKQEADRFRELLGGLYAKISDLETKNTVLENERIQLQKEINELREE